MGFYRKHILPRLLHLSMRNREATRLRQQVIPQARGRVLEIGVGSGLNLPFYSPDVTEVVGIDPSEELLAMARRAARRAPVPVRLARANALTKKRRFHEEIQPSFIQIRPRWIWGPQ